MRHNQRQVIPIDVVYTAPAYPVLSATYRSWPYTISRVEGGVGHWMVIHDEHARWQHTSWLNASAAIVDQAAKQTIDSMLAANERQEGKAA